MYAGSRGLATYGKVASTESDPLRQIVLLYDGAIRFLNLTASDIDAGDVVAKAEHSGRALDIIAYLQGTLDFEKGGEVAVRLDHFYRHVTSIALRGSARQSAEMMRAAARLMVPVREAWEKNASVSGAITSTAMGSI